jgi:hypothetical protein
MLAYRHAVKCHSHSSSSSLLTISSTYRMSLNSQGPESFGTPPVLRLKANSLRRDSHVLVTSRSDNLHFVPVAVSSISLTVKARYNHSQTIQYCLTVGWPVVKPRRVNRELSHGREVQMTHYYGVPKLRIRGALAYLLFCVCSFGYFPGVKL